MANISPIYNREYDQPFQPCQIFPLSTIEKHLHTFIRENRNIHWQARLDLTMANISPIHNRETFPYSYKREHQNPPIKSSAQCKSIQHPSTSWMPFTLSSFMNPSLLSRTYKRRGFYSKIVQNMIADPM